MTLVLFDIDGTLVRTGGAGSRAMSRAFEDLFGVSGAFDGIPMAGRTDRRILEDAAVRAGVDLDPLLQRFRDRYVERLREALSEIDHPKGVMPGVRTLLEALVTHPPKKDLFVALLTGRRVRSRCRRAFGCGGDRAVELEGASSERCRCRVRRPQRHGRVSAAAVTVAKRWEGYPSISRTSPARGPF